ncbi:hypothetical protein I317_05061 [Kwoniella heveanensis CBS 569]|uniref:Zn(2)-C6 fungal-type domain-containing protein n=1 Tax=Kwoniella heveanensis BCC8398 TaxID=1296120 RepID=A0A1B9GIF3_9TREE|nr:hypothetical protein I316_07483 [Kwoniella heveanensis BCC8398]OCF41147.1 hypothetical protein I317_05061 [Kwoniella heveanensis CBS 569]
MSPGETQTSPIPHHSPSATAQSRAPAHRHSDDDDVGSPNKRPQKKRKQRQQFSCAECRRLKLKCDRQIPCANCVRRSCGHLCPERERPQGNAGATGLLSRLETLEGVLQQHGIPLPTSSAQTSAVPTRAPSSVPAVQQQPPPPSALHTGRDQQSFAASSHDLSQAASPIVNQKDLAEASGSHTSPPQPTATASTHALFDLANAAALTHYTPPSSSSTIQPTEADNGPLMTQQELHRVRFDFSTPSAETLSMHPSVEAPMQQDSPDTQSYGTLVLSHGGRSKYLGPTAASEWLKDQEIHEPVESPSASRYASPDRDENAAHSTNIAVVGAALPTGFPFRSSQMSTDDLLARLPPIDEGLVLVDCYFRYFAWHFDVVPRRMFQQIFDRMYTAADRRSQQRHMHQQHQQIAPQELGLVYIILALGALHSLELRPNDPAADNYCKLSQACLAKGDFLVHTTLAGVQTLHIMGHFMLETEKGRNGDSAWPLWGMAMRLSQAMGLHRDGARWNLSPEVVEERRRVFWESFSVDIFQANCFSRPSSLSLDYVDTAFPANTAPISSEEDFYRSKFQLSQISAAILERAMKVRQSSYQTVTDLHQRLCDFERQVPFRLRCRAALLALPSVYSNPELAINDSPAIAQRNLILAFQQCTLAINISETVLFLHRPFYARAMYEAEDPTRSTFGLSFLAVVERCHVMINVVASLYALHPNVAARHWFLWYHAFNCAVCIGTLIFRNPKNPLAAFALSQIDATITLYTSLVQAGASKRILNNLRWLLRLRAQAARKIQRSTGGTGSHTPQGSGGEESDDENIELIGLKTRLIERASKGLQTAKTIFQSTPSATGTTEESPNANVHDTISMALQELLYSSGAPGQNLPEVSDAVATSDPTDLNDTSTNDLLHQFWDPMMLQDASEKDGLAFTDSNWWNWEASTGMQGGSGNPSTSDSI